MRPIVIVLLFLTLCPCFRAEPCRAQNPAPTPTPAKTKVAFAESLGIRLAPIRDGEFVMGSSLSRVESEETRFSKFPKELFRAELPSHTVKITKLSALSDREITVGQFGAFIADTGYRTDAETDNRGGAAYDAETKAFRQSRRYFWNNPGFPQTANHPVVNVSWDDAVAFTSWLSRKDGRDFRLPTDAEWEYCCRAGSVTAYVFGEDPETLARYDNILDRTGSRTVVCNLGVPIAADDGYIYTAPVGGFRPNPFGLYDMHGNVSEWCLDGYDDRYYVLSPPADPLFRPEASTQRIIRGGNWSRPPGFARSAHRDRGSPKRKNPFLGFRIALGKANP